LLRIISSAKSKNETLTYADAAKLMGRPKDHARAMASTCNLLDAAACLAGVPLLALIVVLAQSGEINPEAFTKEFNETQRKAIIERSKNHKFKSDDYDALSKALDDLGDRGAISAWKYIEKQLYPGNLFYLRLIGDYTVPNSNAIEDIGSDDPSRVKTESWSYSRDPKVRDAVLLRANGRCEFCGQPGFIKPDGTHYLECHHVIALASDGEDRTTNVIALCPNDHREAHFGKRHQEIEQEMILQLKILSR
jgi:hypothetical protein